MQVVSEEKKAWAEELLRQKANELGRLPTKKDFDVVTCSRIKAFLGTWPRALETAGLKDAKNKSRNRAKSLSSKANKRKENENVKENTTENS